MLAMLDSVEIENQERREREKSAGAGQNRTMTARRVFRSVSVHVQTRSQRREATGE